MTKSFNFALKIKGSGREGGTCEVLRPCHPPKFGTCTNDYDKPSHFVSLYRASKVTGISICALRNACKKANLTITRRSGGFVEKFQVYLASVCSDCCPKTKKELSWEIS